MKKNVYVALPICHVSESVSLEHDNIMAKGKYARRERIFNI